MPIPNLNTTPVIDGTPTDAPADDADAQCKPAPHRRRGAGVGADGEAPGRLRPCANAGCRPFLLDRTRPLIARVSSAADRACAEGATEHRKEQHGRLYQPQPIARMPRRR